MNLLMISGDRSVLQGKQSAFWYTLQEFAKHWDRIDIVCPFVHVDQYKAVSAQCYKPMDAEVYFHPSPWPLWRQSQWIVQRGQQLHESTGFSVMTAHEYPPFYNGIGAWLLHKKTGVPYALEVHHIVGHPVAASLSEFVGRLLSYAVLRFDAKPATAVRVVNQAMTPLLGRWGVPHKKIHVVPSFYLDFTAITSAPKPKKTTDVVCCGRLVPNKQFDIVIDAVASVSGMTLSIIGDGPERARLERKILEAGAQDRIKILGWLPDQKAVFRAMKSGRVFVMYSSSEGGPRVLLEAMALGLPVVSTSVGIAPDAIRHGENGLLSGGSKEELAEHVQRLLGDKTLQERLGNEAIAILQRFSRETLVANYATFLKSFVK